MPLEEKDQLFHAGDSQRSIVVVTGRNQDPTEAR